MVQQGQRPHVEVAMEAMADPQLQEEEAVRGGVVGIASDQKEQVNLVGRRDGRYTTDVADTLGTCVFPQVTSGRVQEDRDHLQ